MATIDISKNRDSRTQAAINAVAKTFLRRVDGDEIAWLRRVLGAEPKFTFSEARMLVSRLGATSILNFYASGALFPVMYNWALTLDYVMAQMKTLAMMVANIDSNITLSAGDLAFLETSIFHPSFRPWVDVAAGRNVGMTPAAKMQQSLIRGGADAAAEAALLASPIVSMLIALAQGNYKKYFDVGTGEFDPNPAWAWLTPARTAWDAAARTIATVPQGGGPAVVPVGYEIATMRAAVAKAVALAAAVKRAQVTSSINKYYRDLQVEFARVHEYSPIGQVDPFGPDFGRNQISGPMISNALKCGRGMMPVYIDSANAVVPPRDAFVTINGRKYLSHAVDPTKSYCTQMVGAFGASVFPSIADQSGQTKVHARANLPFDASARTYRRRRKPTTATTTVRPRRRVIRRRRTTTARAMLLQNNEAAMGAMMLGGDNMFKAPRVRRRVVRRRTTAAAAKPRVYRKRTVVRKRKPVAKIAKRRVSAVKRAAAVKRVSAAKRTAVKRRPAARRLRRVPLFSF